METTYLGKWKYSSVSENTISNSGPFLFVLEMLKCTPVTGSYNPTTGDHAGLLDRTLTEMVRMDAEAMGNFWGAVQTFVKFYGMTWVALKKDADGVSHENKEEFDKNVLELGRVFVLESGVLESETFDISKVLAEE